MDYPGCLIGTFAMDDDNPHWIVPVELVTFQQVKLKQPNWLRKLQKKKHVFLLEESVWHRYRPAILASWHVFSGRYSDLFPNPVANLQLLAMESPRDADCERSAEFLTPA